MIRFLDGPAEGRDLMLRRAPHFLRVTTARRRGEVKVDALDQPDDEPTATETVHVYVVDPSTRSGYFLCGTRPRSASGRYASADYRHLPVDADVQQRIRDRDAWRRWVLAAGDAAAAGAGLPVHAGPAAAATEVARVQG